MTPKKQWGAINAAPPAIVDSQQLVSNHQDRTARQPADPNLNLNLNLELDLNLNLNLDLDMKLNLNLDANLNLNQAT